MQHNFSTLVELLRFRADTTPDRITYVFLPGDDQEVVSLTYGELDRRARSIAAHLAARTLSGERAILLFQPGLDFVVAMYGCLYAGVIAIPVIPPFGRRNGLRLQSVMQDAQTHLVVTTANLQKK